MGRDFAERLRDGARIGEVMGRHSDGVTTWRWFFFLLYKSGENRPNEVRLSTRVFRCLGKSPGICQGVETWESLDKRTSDSQVLPKMNQ